MRSKSWKAVELQISTQAYDQVTGILYSCGCEGIEENTDDGSVRLTAYYTATEQCKAAVTAVKPLCESISLQDVPDTDWEAEFRKNLKPVRLSKRFMVKPLRYREESESNAGDIFIEPKMTFGTGHHETTQICAEFLEELNLTGKSVLDIGTGTGILAIVAERCGANPVTAFDIDPVIVENLPENLQNNQSKNIHPFVGTVEAVRNGQKYDVVVVNMIKSRVYTVLAAAIKLLDEGGNLILSGFLLPEKKEVVAVLKSKGIFITGQKVKGEWWGALCEL